MERAPSKAPVLPTRRTYARFILGAAMLCFPVRPVAAMWINHGDGSYTYVPDILLLAVPVVVIALAAAAAIVSTPTYRPPSPREMSADEYNADALILAARRHHTEMMTELRKAEIEAARIEAIHDERDEIIAHDRKVRDLNARLDEQGRST